MVVGVYGGGMRDSEQRPSERVVEAVAANQDVDPIELKPLYEVVDPDALDAIVGPSGDVGPAAACTVEFDYAGVSVVVRTDGSVHVEESPGVVSQSRGVE